MKNDLELVVMPEEKKEKKSTGVTYVKKNNKRKSQRLLVLLLLLLMTGVMLGTSTYAWFTSNKTVTVSDITVNVSTATGLQISADAKNFKTVISNTDLYNASTVYTGAKNQIPRDGASMSPVSTVGAIDTDTGYMNMYLGELNANDGTTYKCGEELQFCLTSTQTTEANGATGNFIAFDIFLKLQSTAATQLYLNLDSSKVIASGTSTGIENASRIAFIVEGNGADGTALTTLQGYKAGVSHAETGSTTYIWEPNYDTHTATGVNNYNTVYNQYNTTDYPAVTFDSTTNKSTILNWYGVNQEIAAANSQKRYSTATYFTKVTPDYTTTNGQTGQLQIFTIQPGITKIRVYMWVEGQDADCEDAASGGNITYNLQFTTQSATSSSSSAG